MRIRIEYAPANRMPVKIVGTAAGRITFWNSRTGVRPNERADLMSSGSTVRTPLIVLSRIGHAQPYRMIATFEVSPSPRMSTNTGSSASAAVLRNTSSSGLSSVATGRYQPMSSPSGTARTIARPNPDSDRIRLASTCWASWPVTSSRDHATSTSDSGGRNVGSTRFRRGSVSQTASSAAMATERWVADRSRPSGRPGAFGAAATVGGGSTRVRTLVNEHLLGLSLDHLVAQQAPDLVPVPGEQRIRPQVLGGPPGTQRNVDELLDAAGPRRHDRDPLAEVDRLVDAVRDEHDGLAGLLPDPQQ